MATKPTFTETPANNQPKAPGQSEDRTIEPKPENRRKYPRLKAPKGTFAGWKLAGKTVFARVDTIGLGGVYLNTLTPLALDTTFELILGLPNGKICTSAKVRRSVPARGMGLQFVQMPAEARAKLSQFLLQQETPTRAPGSNKPPATEPAKNSTDRVLFESELKQMVKIAREGTYYDLLAVTPESPNKQIRNSYYSLARRFHPDHHMDKSEFIGSLKELMVVVTEAYNTLRDDQKRASYDKLLTATGAFNLQREKNESRESVEEFLTRAKECLRANNFVGSIVWLRKCVQMAPDEPKYHAMLARSLATVVAYRDEAIEHFQKTIDLDPWNAMAYFQLGELYEKMQLPWRARPLYSKILELDPENAKVRERLAHLDSEAGSEKSPSLMSRVFGRRN